MENREIRAVLTPDRAEKRQNGRRIKEPDDPMFTLTSQDKHGVYIAEATKKGYSEAYEGDSINLTCPNSTTRRGRVGKGIANTLDTSCNQATMTEGRIRRLTPKECFRLQGFPDDYFERAAQVNSDSQLYKQAGNSVTVNVIYEIAQRLEVEKEMDYNSFLMKKRFILESSGFNISKYDLNLMLYDFQCDIVRWALAKGKAAIFADCGLGKTPMQLEWGYQVHKYTGGNVLLLAPLAVSEQTKREGDKFNIPVTICRNQADVQPGINITNYEMLHNFVASSFTGIILDESSILKHFDSKMRTQIIENFSQTPFRLACTATPAPNDYMELGNHSEFLGVMTRAEMLSMYFVHDGGDTSKWRLKRHAEDIFWQWTSSWSVFISNPSDLGYDGGRYNLPELIINERIVDGDETSQEVLSLMERREARRESLESRVKEAAEIAKSIEGQCLIWCDLNFESELLTKSIPGAVEVKGSDKPEHKKNAMLGFSKGEVRVLVTKPSIAGFGMNWQNCSNMIFVGLSDSYEQYYQAVRRCYRFGQEKPVNVHIVISAKEGCVKENIERKTRDAEKMQAAMIELTKEITKKELQSTKRITTPYNPELTIALPQWEEMRKIASF